MSSTIGRTPRRARASAAALVVALVAGSLAGCAAGELTGTAGQGKLAIGGGGTGGSVLPTLVGQWFRLVYVPDSTGSVRTSETTLDLRGDGTLVRTVASRNLSIGFVDQVVSTGTWRATPTTLTVTITTVGTTGTAVDTSRTNTGLPTLTPNPPFGTTPSSPVDTVGTSSGTTSYSYRIETTSQGTTLFLNETPFVRLVTTP